MFSQFRRFEALPKSNLYSQVLLYSRYLSMKQESGLDRAMLVISTDIDVGSSHLGLLNRGQRDRDVNDSMSEFQVGKIEELAIPILLKTFDQFQVPITLAVRGQLTELASKTMDVMLESQVKHDIGAHGYFHKTFTELSQEEAENELALISTGMKKYDLAPRSFIFPKNRVKHLNLLVKYNYMCYRCPGDVFSNTMLIEKEGELYNFHPSAFLCQDSSLFVLKKMLNIAVRNRLPLHLWFHFWNFGMTEMSIRKFNQHFLIPFVSYASKKCDKNLLTFNTMLSASKHYFFNN